MIVSGDVIIMIYIANQYTPPVEQGAVPHSHVYTVNQLISSSSSIKHSVIRSLACKAAFRVKRARTTTFLVGRSAFVVERARTTTFSVGRSLTFVCCVSWGSVRTSSGYMCWTGLRIILTCPPLDITLIRTPRSLSSELGMSSSILPNLHIPRGCPSS